MTLRCISSSDLFASKLKFHPSCDVTLILSISYIPFSQCLVQCGFLSALIFVMLNRGKSFPIKRTAGSITSLKHFSPLQQYEWHLLTVSYLCFVFLHHCFLLWTKGCTVDWTLSRVGSSEQLSKTHGNLTNSFRLNYHHHQYYNNVLFFSNSVQLSIVQAKTNDAFKSFGMFSEFLPQSANCGYNSSLRRN